MMPQTVRIFVSSPSDVADEREQLSKVVNSLNSTISAIAPEKGITLELVRYETHTHPDVNVGGAQGAVSHQLGDIGEYDIFIGVMWKRFGTPTPQAGSGTEQEFQEAYDDVLSGGKKIRHIIFYFCQEKITIPRSRDELEQLARVVAFREKLSGMGLVGEYSDRAKFSDVVKAHLDIMLSRLFSKSEEVAEAAQRIGHAALGNDTVREQVVSLAAEYVRTRREKFTPERTQKLEDIFTRMKACAMVAYVMLPELASSVPQNRGEDEKAGERAVAVAFLEQIPNKDYIGWLAERFGREQPFIEYHAAVALRNAARDRRLRAQHKDALRGAIMQALDELPPGSTDRRTVLEDALGHVGN